MPNYYNPLNVMRTNAISQTPEQNASMFSYASQQTSTSTQQTVTGQVVALGDRQYYISSNTAVFVTYPKGNTSSK